MGGNSIGLDLAPKVAARLRTGLTAHCVELSIEEVDGKHLLVGAIPGFGGNVMVKIACPEKMPQMVTVRPGVFEKAAREEGRKGEIVKVKPRIKKEELRIRTLEVVEEKPSEATLDEAEAIVVGGWGLQAAGGFDPVEELAGILGGVVAGTRPAVDAGWIPEQKMIGVSGKTVSPKLLVSVGASGAMHFVAGFPKAKCVLAINKDPKAPIFEACDIGIVGDLREVVPQLCQKLKELTL
jgi:electron transfer flavoprotein alpha subunit